MKEKPRIQLKSSQHMLANLMANSKASINLQNQFGESRINTLGMSKTLFVDNSTPVYGSTKYEINKRTKENSVPYVDPKIDSARKKPPMPTSKFFKDSKELFYKELANNDLFNKLHNRNGEKKQFAIRRQQQLQQQIREADIKVKMLQQKSDSLQKYIQDQQFFNKSMQYENESLQNQIGQLKTLINKLELLQKSNLENQKLMNKAQQQWFKGKEMLLSDLRNDFKIEAENINIAR